MNVKEITQPGYVITMTREEALWLKGLTQNPINVRYPQDEPKEDRSMRAAFWEALQGVPW